MSESWGRSFPAHMPPCYVCYVFCYMRKFKAINFAVRLGSLSLEPCLLYKYIFRLFCYVLGQVFSLPLQMFSSGKDEVRFWVPIPVCSYEAVGQHRVSPYFLTERDAADPVWGAGKMSVKKDRCYGRKLLHPLTSCPPPSPSRSTQRILIQCQTERKAS